MNNPEIIKAVKAWRSELATEQEVVAAALIQLNYTLMEIKGKLYGKEFTQDLTQAVRHGLFGSDAAPSETLKNSFPVNAGHVSKAS